ncbi:MAG: magnesium transporter MgtE N-terminal domain-containing protein [Streptomycetales bacterium]
MVSGLPTRVFIARLAGVAVFDPNGDHVGRVRDVIVTLGVGDRPPSVLGLVIEVQPRRRVFLPVTRVTAIDVGQVITTGLVNLRRFEQRPGETLVLAELLDRRVTLVESGEPVTVLDVAMEQKGARDWRIGKVFAGRPGRRLRRHGETFVVNWDAVTGLSLTEEDQGAASLLAALDTPRAADLAGVMHDLSAKRRAEVAAALDDERLAEVLEEMSEDDQVQILGELGRERAAHVLEVMGPDDAADLLGELPTDQAEDLLQLMRPGEAEPLRRLLTYSDDTAGGLMTSEPVVLPPDATVAEALARVRAPKVDASLAAQVYVCRPPHETPTGTFLGIAGIQRLLREPPSTLLGGIVDTAIEPLSPGMSLQTVTSYLATYNLVAVPVVDEDDHLLGAVTVDDVLDHLLPDDWRERSPHEEGGAHAAP